MSDWPIGSRVRIKSTLADGFIQPLRNWAKKGRIGTVEGVFRDGDLRVRFDCASPPKFPQHYTFAMKPRELEAGGGRSMSAYRCAYCGCDRWTSDYADPPIRCVQCDRQPGVARIAACMADAKTGPAAHQAAELLHAIADEIDRATPEGTSP